MLLGIEATCGTHSNLVFTPDEIRDKYVAQNLGWNVRVGYVVGLFTIREARR